eukprot:10437855-Alexandrium_andersonii.AAC.1
MRYNWLRCFPCSLEQSIRGARSAMRAGICKTFGEVDGSTAREEGKWHSRIAQHAHLACQACDWLILRLPLDAIAALGCACQEA